jgi:ribosomal protein S1
MALASILAIGLAAPLNLKADDASAEGTPVKGKISSVDKTSQTVTVDNQTYQVLPTTQIKKNNQAATFSDLAVGQQLTANYKKSSEGKMELLSAEVGAQDTASSSASADGNGTFSGRISKVDTKAGTFTIAGQTYQVVATSQLMRDQKRASINDLKPGERLAGQYKMSAENKMEVLHANIGATSSAVGGTRDIGSTDTGASFSGKVTKVDLAAQTFMIGNKTYQLLPTTTIASTDGTTATVVDLKENPHVTGTYKKSAEGKLEVTSLHITEKK